jgi:hypothetical protein
VAFAVQLHHYPRPQHRVVLGAAHPLGQLPTRARPDGELVAVERHEHRVQAGGGRAARALTGGLSGALPDRLGGCASASQGRAAGRLCAATARWFQARRRPRSPSRGVQPARRHARLRRGLLGSGWAASPPRPLAGIWTADRPACLVGASSLPARRPCWRWSAPSRRFSQADTVGRPSRARSAPCRLGEKYPDCYTYACRVGSLRWPGRPRAGAWVVSRCGQRWPSPAADPRVRAHLRRPRRWSRRGCWPVSRPS